MLNKYLSNEKVFVSHRVAFFSFFLIYVGDDPFLISAPGNPPQSLLMVALSCAFVGGPSYIEPIKGNILNIFVKMKFHFMYLIYFGPAVQLAGSQFPDQGSNLGHGSDSTKS